MEQDQCWMWTKRRNSPTNYNPSSYDESWEEQAFAKDAGGSDCIWPPRSYSCSFCSREFRSAQALGGHMNVHRRDRARLKQPYSPQNEVLGHDLESHVPHNPVQNSFASLDYVSSFSGLAYSSTNPKSDPSQVFPSTSKVLPVSISRNCKEKTLIPLYDSSSSFQGCHETSLDLSSKSLSNLAEDCGLYSYKFDPEGDAQKISKGFDFGCMSEDCNNKTEVAVSLNLFVCRAHPPMQFETKETDKCIKKRKTDASSIPFFLKSNSVEKHDHKQSQMFEFSRGSFEELDLELRLGDKPKMSLYTFSS